MVDKIQRQTAMLKANLIKRGWAPMEDGTISFANLVIRFNSSGWEMTKEGEACGGADFGPTQMSDVRDAATKAGATFSQTPIGGTTPRKKPGEGGARKGGMRNRKKKGGEEGAEQAE